MTVNDFNVGDWVIFKSCRMIYCHTRIEPIGTKVGRDGKVIVQLGANLFNLQDLIDLERIIHATEENLAEVFNSIQLDTILVLRQGKQSVETKVIDISDDRISTMHDSGYGWYITKDNIKDLVERIKYKPQ